MECFINNKYTRTYHKIITNAQQRDISPDFVERHHIVPRALGGSDDTDNIVSLTPREHYICHALLPKMVEGAAIHKMYAAFNMMHVDRYGNRYTGKLYEYYKIKFYRHHSEAQKGKKRSMESRRKQSETTKGRPWSKRAREVVRDKPTAKPVLVYKKDDGSFVGEWESVSLCGTELGCDITTIWKICEGKPSRPAPNGDVYPMKSHKGYTFRYRD